jgi:RHH-type proline utilization regulon transcriptional repressor/proline dehydrogenase/delta 1-pyrroline-5-carboxylate dehydrogenase
MPLDTLTLDAALDWDALDAVKYRDETEAVTALVAAAPLTSADREAVRAEAIALVEATRRAAKRQGVVESFLQEYSLGAKEGLALMALAEALLRTPDEDTRDKLIAEKITAADWASHAGKSDNLFVNASTWGLMLTGKLIDVEPAARADFPGYLRRLTARLGEPVIRAAVMQAIRIMGEQFVLGRDIEQALRRAKREDVMCSFDMLGEGARTAADAARYEESYAAAIETVGRASNGAGPERGHGVSVKLSALSPRYEAVQEARVWAELYPRLKRLALIAACHDLNFTIDAEEADRLVLSLKLLDRLAREPELGTWTGLGLAVQAYQKRSPRVIAQLAELARSSGRRLMVRLVKGAYWDSEIKRAQIAGRPDYPGLHHQGRHRPQLPRLQQGADRGRPAPLRQFATHNAHTLAAVRRMADRAATPIEFQRLHGMGEALYRGAGEAYGRVTLRAYAPVGGHEDLLPYLVRRLLENGANTSFVHALLDERVPAATRRRRPDHGGGAGGPRAAPQDRSPASPLQRPPQQLAGRGPERESGAGAAGRGCSSRQIVGDLIGSPDNASGPVRPSRDVLQPVDGRWTGTRRRRRPRHRRAHALARAAQPAWDASAASGRGRVLRAMADSLEANRDRLVALLAREAGKTLPTASPRSRGRRLLPILRLPRRASVRRPDTLAGPWARRTS